MKRRGFLAIAAGFAASVGAWRLWPKWIAVTETTHSTCVIECNGVLFLTSGWTLRVWTDVGKDFRAVERCEVTGEALVTDNLYKSLAPLSPLRMWMPGGRELASGIILTCVSVPTFESGSSEVVKFSAQGARSIG